ncbi:MAG: DUF6036 family nucleotidyltransferase [Deltaproteobacteria bacterium]|nr:DUF6036 family nucleotidyltransferase [Deltaproteobacteria bacterium]
MPFQSASLRDALAALGEILADRGLVHDIAVVGGGALLLSGHIERATKDLDVVARVVGDTWMVAEPMPADLVDAVRDVGVALELAPDWLNAGPASLFTAGLPVGFGDRAAIHRFGSLTVRLASRADQIALKVYAAADDLPLHGKHLQDLRALTPTKAELGHAARWCVTHDPSAGFRETQLAPLLALFSAHIGGADD